MNDPAVKWSRVLRDEYRALYGESPHIDGAPADEKAMLRALHQKIHERGPSALCLSGGGVRSATFALGVLQGLAHSGVLGTIDYLSTVSGGGYTGGWFTAWLKREGPSGREEVLRTIDPGRALQQTDSSRGAHDVSPVERVRRNCRYLAPRGGVVSADVWTLVTTMSRNLLLNWLVILPILAAALMIPRIYYGGLQAVEHPFLTQEQFAAGRLCSVTGDASWWSFWNSRAAFGFGAFLNMALGPTMSGVPSAG